MALRTIPDVTEPKEKSEKEQEIETVLNQVSSGLVIPLGKGVTCDRNWKTGLYPICELMNIKLKGLRSARAYASKARKWS